MPFPSSTLSIFGVFLLEDEKENKENQIIVAIARPGFFHFPGSPDNIKNISITIFVDFKAYSLLCSRVWKKEGKSVVCGLGKSVMTHPSRLPTKYQKSHETFSCSWKLALSYVCADIFAELFENLPKEGGILCIWRKRKEPSRIYRGIRNKSLD